MSDATMMISTTWRAARAATHRPSSADAASSTSWTPCGITSGAGGAGGGSAALRPGPPRHSPAAVTRDLRCIRTGCLICGSMDARALHTSLAGLADARILFCGDLVGSAGRRALLRLLPGLRERYAPTFVVVNAENVAGGFGITPEIADELLAAGVDVITLGNHAYRRTRDLPLPR